MGHGPTVVFEAGGAGEGIGETFSGTVEEQWAEFATVLTYDRVGSGRSGGKPRETLAAMADDLDALLSATGCKMLRLVVPYLRETKSALKSATLPDVPTQIISPQPRPKWALQLAKVDAAHRAFVARFPRGEFVPANGATHQWLPFERPDVVIEAVRETLALTG